MIHHIQLIEMVLIAIAVFVMWHAVANFSTFKRVVIGRPMRTRELHAKHNKLFWMIALPILSADLYSSVAYGPEAGLSELTHLGKSAQWFVLPVLTIFRSSGSLHDYTILKGALRYGKHNH